MQYFIPITIRIHEGLNLKNKNITPMFSFCKNFIGKIDYKGQKLAKRNTHLIYVIGYFIALLFGFVMSNLYYTLIFSILTNIVAFVVVCPSWSFYNRNPIKFKEAKKEKNE
ncbi:microsomal signal peptidase Spc12 [Spraguea lophii 42_110]|uniref:Signal peptidase complex subunit 1 n=1 Tax=Spraguea lophii (strain 42_110) TaxID=1358809 RepID=S7XJF9_SPRLO|nr:microsomal signal peptidase Spc12 [Spraguea lophii 42_110]